MREQRRRRRKEQEQADEEWDDDFFKMMMEDDASAFMYGMFQYATHLDKHCNRAEHMAPAVSGLEWVQMKLADRGRCYNMFRMTPNVFRRLHDLLVHQYGLPSNPKCTSLEALGLFLWVVGGSMSVRQAEDRFERSLATIHNVFYRVLPCVISLAEDILKPRDPLFTNMHPRLSNPRFYPFFKDCVGAIDGTHIPVIVPKDKLVQYTCRKGITTQNVMACCDFDMVFTFVLAGWPGSVHDMRVFDSAMSTYSHKFPHPPTGTHIGANDFQFSNSLYVHLQGIGGVGKYYLVDSGYTNRPGYLAPYKGSKYPLPEFQSGHEPEGKKELFNYAHSSLRNVIERSFGVLKMKWQILQHMPSYPPETQKQIIVACFALHNFIRLSGLVDDDFDMCDRNENYVPDEASVHQPSTVSAPSRDDGAEMNAFRDRIALGLLQRR